MTRAPLTDPTAVVARRGGAWFIDMVLCGLCGGVPALLLADAYSGNFAAGGAPVRWIEGDLAIFIRDTTIVLRGSDVAITLSALVVGTLLLLVLLPGRRGWSPGYLAADLRLVTRTGERAGVGRALVRTMALLVDNIPGLPLVAYASARVTKRHQRVGDLLAKTYVVDKRADGRPVDEAVTEEVLLGEPVLEPEPESEPEPETESTPEVDPEPTRSRPSEAGRSTPPEGVPVDEPIWDRRHRRYVMWHSRAARWLEHTDAGWIPLDETRSGSAAGRDG